MATPKKIRIDSTHLDANENIFFARQLEYIMAQTYDVVYPEYKAMRLFPVSTEAGAGAESITYRQFDRVGMMKVISNYSDGLPRVNVKAKEFTTPVRPLGSSYGYNIDEVRAARFANKPLEMLEAEAARQAYEQAVNQIAFFAYPDDKTWGGLTGLLYQPNVTVGSAAVGAWLGGSTTPDQIIADMNKAVSDMIKLTKGVEMPDTILLPLAQWAYIFSTPRSINSDTTIGDYFLKNSVSVRNVEALNELQDIAQTVHYPSGNRKPGDDNKPHGHLQERPSESTVAHTATVRAVPARTERA